MVVVDDLDEGLNLGALGNLLLTHSTGNLQRIAFDTGNHGIAIGSVLGTFIVVCKMTRNMSLQVQRMRHPNKPNSNSRRFPVTPMLNSNTKTRLNPLPNCSRKRNYEKNDAYCEQRQPSCQRSGPEGSQQPIIHFGIKKCSTRRIAAE